MISIKYKNLRLCALVLLAIPSLIFFLSWLKIYIGIPFALLLIGALIYCARQQDDRSLSIKKSTLAVIVAVIMLWCFLSGMGGFFVQKSDYLYRNAIFRDLINFDWPVRYATGNDESLVYYIGYWLFPALIGKIGAAIGGADAGFLTGSVAILLWSTVLITVAFLLVCFYVGASRRKFVYTALAVFILFSGMDAIGSLFHPESFLIHIEWWTNYFQFSSMSTQLCWVFNQAVPAWIATALMLNEKDKSAFALIGLAILPSSPFPLVGLVIFMLCIAVRDFVSSVKKKQLVLFFKEIFSLPNIAAVITILPTFTLYYINNSVSGAESDAQIVQEAAGSVPFLVAFDEGTIILYFFFIITEFAVLMALLKNRENRFLSLIITVSLLVLPIFRIGTGFDFCMRTSIPALFVLMELLIKFFIDYSKEKDAEKEKNGKENKRLKVKFIAVLLVFIIGCVTPFVEYFSSFRYVYLYGQKAIGYYDTIGSLESKPIGSKRNFVGEDSSNSLFYKTIGKS